jgi:hypothetical protein
MDHLCKTLQGKLDTALELGRKSLSNKPDRKLDELREKYEKLLKNVRAEERERYQMELKRIEEASIKLALENENLKKQLEEVQTVIFTGRKREPTDEAPQGSRSARTSSVKRRRR